LSSVYIWVSEGLSQVKQENRGLELGPSLIVFWGPNPFLIEFAGAPFMGQNTYLAPVIVDLSRHPRNHLDTVVDSGRGP